MNYHENLVAIKIADPTVAFDPLRSQSGCKPLIIDRSQQRTIMKIDSMHLVPQTYTRHKELLIKRHGYELRLQIRDPATYPFSAQVFLLIEFKSYKNWGQHVKGQGSGTMIGPNLILTAAHNVRRIGHNGSVEDAERVYVVPGAYGDQNPFDQYESEEFLISPDFNADNEDRHCHDWAVIVLKDPVGNSTGWLGIACLTDQELTGLKVNIVGYPGDKDQQLDRQQWGAGDPIQNIEEEMLTYWIDTVEGQSGSGVWVWTDPKKEPYIVGVHAYGPDTQKTPPDEWENVAVRLSQSKFQLLVTWMAEYTYKDRLYPIKNFWSQTFCNKEDAEFLEAQIQIAMDLFNKPCFFGTDAFSKMLAYSLRTGRFLIFCEIESFIRDLSNLSRLNLTNAQIGDREVKMLNKIEWRLESLNLAKNQIGNEGVKALDQNKIWPLKTLNLESNQIEDDGIKNLVKNKHWHLEYLYLRRNNIGDEGATYLAKKGTWELSVLDLAENPIKEASFDAFRYCRLPSQTTSKNNDATQGDERQGTNSSLLEQERKGTTTCSLMFPINKSGWGSDFLLKVELTYSRITDELASCLSQNSTLHLKELNLEGNLITDKGVEALTKNEAWKLRALNLGGNEIKAEGAKVLANNTTWQLRILNLSGNEIKDEGSKALADNTAWPLEILNLTGNSIGNDGVITLAGNTAWHLEVLNLAENAEIEDQGIIAIANNTSWSLYELNLYGTKVKEKGAQLLTNKFMITALEACRNVCKLLRESENHKIEYKTNKYYKELFCQMARVRDFSVFVITKNDKHEGSLTLSNDRDSAYSNGFRRYQDQDQDCMVRDDKYQLNSEQWKGKVLNLILPAVSFTNLFFDILTKKEHKLAHRLNLHTFFEKAG